MSRESPFNGIRMGLGRAYFQDRPINFSRPSGRNFFRFTNCVLIAIRGSVLSRLRKSNASSTNGTPLLRVMNRYLLGNVKRGSLVMRRSSIFALRCDHLRSGKGAIRQGGVLPQQTSQRHPSQSSIFMNHVFGFKERFTRVNVPMLSSPRVSNRRIKVGLRAIQGNGIYVRRGVMYRLTICPSAFRVFRRSLERETRRF